MFQDGDFGPVDLYLNAAECHPTKGLTLEFRDIMDVVQDDMLGPPIILIFWSFSKPWLHEVKEIAEGPPRSDADR